MNVNVQIGDSCVQEIYTWLDEIPLSRPKRNIARDFSDGILMAEILKRYYPKYVDLQNYVSGNSIARKIENWFTLNRKVFPKIHMKLKKDTINQIARSQAGVIEKLLLDVHSKIINDYNKNRNSLFADCGESDTDSLKFIKHPEESLNEIVAQKALIKVKKELDEKNEAIRILLKKVEHLENMLKFKEQRINDLSVQATSHVEQNLMFN